MDRGELMDVIYFVTFKRPLLKFPTKVGCPKDLQWDWCSSTSLSPIWNGVSSKMANCTDDTKWLMEDQRRQL